jgi:hypothetical protein
MWPFEADSMPYDEGAIATSISALDLVLLSLDPGNRFQENSPKVVDHAYVAQNNNVPSEEYKEAVFVVEKIKKTTGGVGNGWCVDYARAMTGIEHNGNAWYWKNYINSSAPAIGSIAVMAEGPVGHLSVVKEVNEETIILSEQNYIGRYIISSREVDINYGAIIGYVNK